MASWLVRSCPDRAVQALVGDIISPGHNQNWIYSDVIELYKMAPTLRDAIRGHFSALFWVLKCSFPTVLWETYL